VTTTDTLTLNERAKEASREVARAIEASRMQWGDEPRPRVRAELSATLHRYEGFASEVNLLPQLQCNLARPISLLAALEEKLSLAARWLEAEAEQAPAMATLRELGRDDWKAALAALRDGRSKGDWPGAAIEAGLRFGVGRDDLRSLHAVREELQERREQLAEVEARLEAVLASWESERTEERGEETRDPPE
jgi:hypothetical protein